MGLGGSIIKGVGKIAATGVAAKIGEAAVNKGIDVVSNRVDATKEFIKVPDMFGVTLEEAQKVLLDLGVKTMKSPADPDSKFKDRHEFEIVNSMPKFGKKVSPKSPITLYYVTNEIILDSQLLFEEEEKIKKEKEQRKSEAKATRLAKNRENIDKTVNKFQENFKSAALNTRKGIGKAFPNKKQDKEDVFDFVEKDEA